MVESILVAPFDEHNQRLVDNVHPADWKNPRPTAGYDLVVVGAGTAGLVCAAGTAGLGGRVALIEKHLMGGDCLNVGCVPSKAVLRAAKAWGELGRLSEFGLHGVTAERKEFGSAMERMRALRARISPNDSAARFRELGVDVFLGAGRFVARDKVEVDGRRLSFHRAVVATGGRPAAPPIPGLAEAGFLTNESIFTLTRAPRRLAIVGAGPIGCELAQAFARFGSIVTLLDVAPRILPREDPRTSKLIHSVLESEGVRIAVGAGISEVDADPKAKILRFELEGQSHEVRVDEILVAAGRAPNVEGLGLEAAGVRFDKRGVVVDERLRTSNRRIYACGDVASRFQFTHAADAQARLVIRNAFFLGRSRASDLLIPSCIYTSPEVAHVGAYEEELRASGTRFEELEVPIAEVDRALLDGTETGFLRVLHPPGKDRILGATLVSAHAGESIGELVLAMRKKLGLEELAATIHPYPTQAEAIRKAGDLWRRSRLTPFARRLFRSWFAFRGRRARKPVPASGAG